MDKKTRKVITIIALLIILLASVLAFLIIQNPFILTGQTVSQPDIETYSYTKAICTKDNFCQDHIIECKGNEILDINPIENAHVQHSKNWEDPREKRELCHRN